MWHSHASSLADRSRGVGPVKAESSAPAWARAEPLAYLEPETRRPGKSAAELVSAEPRRARGMQELLTASEVVPG